MLCKCRLRNIERCVAVTRAIRALTLTPSPRQFLASEMAAAEPLTLLPAALRVVLNRCAATPHVWLRQERPAHVAAASAPPQLTAAASDDSARRAECDAARAHCVAAFYRLDMRREEAIAAASLACVCSTLRETTGSAAGAAARSEVSAQLRALLGAIGAIDKGVDVELIPPRAAAEAYLALARWSAAGAGAALTSRYPNVHSTIERWSAFARDLQHALKQAATITARRMSTGFASGFTAIADMALAINNNHHPLPELPALAQYLRGLGARLAPAQGELPNMGVVDWLQPGTDVTFGQFQELMFSHALLQAALAGAPEEED